MKKSGKKLAITAILAGSVIAAVSACQQNVTVYGPPEDFTNENSNNEASKPSEEIMRRIELSTLRKKIRLSKEE